MLEAGDFFGFIENISKAEVFAEEDQKTLGEISFLKVRGLFKFNHHQRVIQICSKALEYNTGEKALRLLNWSGISHVHLGYIKVAESVFLKVLAEAKQRDILFETYLNLVWLYLTVNKEKLTDKTLLKAKKYLDEAAKDFDRVSKEMKRRYCNNYSVYCFHMGYYEEAIEILEEAIGYCDERDLPLVNTNLAEIYLKSGKVSEKAILNRFYECCRVAETIGSKYGDYLSIANAKAALARIDLQEGRVISCIDSLYIALENYKKADAYAYAFECLQEINRIISDYKEERLYKLSKSLTREFDCCAYREKFMEGGEKE
jgi:tetratricopeptide (TPR) repeat protein